MERRWTILEPDAALVNGLQQSLKIHPVLCRLLVLRGIHTYAQARSFFLPSLDELHSPWLMKDMDKAVNRLLAAEEKQESIMVFGDYDVDGTTSVATMYSFLRPFFHSIEFYIPHRYREGYGVSRAGIDYAASKGMSLIISLDCGIKSASLIAYARELGIDFIVCDHHLPDESLPPAAAILNPKQADCPYPFKELCGCGVGFKLICALAEKKGIPQSDVLVYLDLVATAIAADIVPVTGENRILAFHGLIRANSSPNPGISALKHLSGLTGELMLHNLVFMIAPRVNAAGRMDDAGKAVQMFIAADYREALEYAEMLHSDNADRKEADKSITEEALAMISTRPEWTSRKSTVVYSPGWHKGVVGIVASRVIEKHFRPTVVLTRSGDYAAGSARSVPGFNLYEAIHACREHLLGYGGHFAAAGLTLIPENIDAFREKFEEVVSATITPDMLVPEIRIDSPLRFPDISRKLYDQIARMEPSGPGNSQPLFIATGVRNTGYSRLLKDQHIRFSLEQDNIRFTGIGFFMPEKFPLLLENKPLDIVFKPDINEWQGNTTLQLRVTDLRISE